MNNVSEHAHQVALVKRCKAEGIFIYAQENSLQFPIPAWFPPKVKAYLKTILYKLAKQRIDAGQVNGIPDLFIPAFKLYIEMKKPGGKVAPIQKKVHAQLIALGYHVEICYGAKEAWQTVEKYKNSGS